MSRWGLWTLLAVICWGLWAVLSKLIGEALSPAQSQALSTLGMVPILIVLAGSRRLKVIGNRRGGILSALGAGLLTSVGNMAYYHALKSGPRAATVVALGALYPMVTVLLALGLLHERLNRIQLLGLGFSIAAIYLFNVPEERGLFSGWLLVALVSVVLWGIAGLLQKVATNHLSGELAALWFLLAFIPVAAAIVYQASIPVSIGTHTWLVVTLLGLSFALGNFALLAAFAAGGKASIITPLAGLYPLISIPIAVIVLHERISWREATGVMLALSAVTALAWESRSPSTLNSKA